MRSWFPRVVLVGVIVAGFFSVWWTSNIEFKGCPVEELTEAQKAGIAEVTDTVKWSLALSVGLVGLFGSLMLGLKEGPRLTGAAWTLLLAVVCCFSFAAYFALVWRTGLAQALLNGCTAEVGNAKSILRFAFDALTYSFSAGLCLLAIILALVVLDRTEG
jgi:hypothetical protein